MKTYFADIIPKIQKFSQRLDDLTRLTNQHWVSIGEIHQTKKVYIFRPNNQLLISENGVVEKGSWDYLGNNSLLMETKSASYLLKHSFLDENIIALKLDSSDNYAFFVNESKNNGELNTIQDVLRFLENKYLKNNGENGRISSEKGPPPTYTPAYTVEFISEKTSFWGNTTKEFQIRFADGIIGEVYLKVSNNQAYYIEKPVNTYNTWKHYYESFEYCVEALYCYLKSGRLQRKGYIVSS